MKSSVVRGIVGLALGLGGATAAQGEALTTLEVARELRLDQQDAPPPGQPTSTAPVLNAAEREWTFVAMPGAWLPWEVEGDGTIQNVDAQVKLKPHALWDDADTYATNVRLEAWNASGWGLFGEVQYLSFDGDDYHLVAGGVPIATRASYELNHLMIDLGGSFRLIDAPETNEKEGWGALDAFAGVRFQNIDQEIYSNPAQNVKDSEDFFEPMFAVRGLIGISDDFALSFRGDFSGFGIGDASNFTWALRGSAVYRITPIFDLEFGYHIFEVDYEVGSGIHRFGLNMTFSGPYVGGVIQF